MIRIKFKINDKLNPSKKLDEKVKKAIEDKHIINATLIKDYVDRYNNTCSGTYEYELVILNFSPFIVGAVMV